VTDRDGAVELEAGETLDSLTHEATDTGSVTVDSVTLEL